MVTKKNKEIYVSHSLDEVLPFNKVYLANVNFDSDYLKITYRRETDMAFIANVVFKYPAAHRVLNESDRLRLTSAMPFPRAYVLKASQSEFIHWLREENHDIGNFDLTHYLVYDSEWVVDVLSFDPPEYQVHED